MNPYFWLFAMMALAITPAEAQARLEWNDGFAFHLKIRIGGLPIPMPRAKGKKKDQSLDWLLAFLSRRKAILKAAGLKVRRAVIRLRLGTKDAAATALACGALCTALQTLRLCGLTVLHGRVEPDFQRTAPEGYLECMIFTRLGSLAMAGMILYLEYAKRVKSKEDGYATAASH